ncbi:MAG TPA: hypothetical protein VLQ68_02560 [Rhizobiaceae bacterium]|nr:hypothetical protein [Rhizobiaceae bacterium]
MPTAISTDKNGTRIGLMLVAMSAAILVAGAAGWLWMKHGLAVYVAQAATFAWNCF